MKKMMALLMVGILVLAMGAAAMAAEPAKMPMPGMNGPMMAGHKMNLTDEQKQELMPLMNQMLEIHKQMLAKQVAWGNLTQEQADQMISHMQARMANGAGGCPMMGGGHGGRGGHDKMQGHGGLGQMPAGCVQQTPSK